MILVAGATGKIGSKLVPKLLEDGYQVRAISRKQENLKQLVEKGVDPAIGDLLDAEFVRQALNGCDQAFFIVQGSPSSGQHQGEEAQMGKNFVTAAKGEGIKHIVFSGSMGAEGRSGCPILDAKVIVEKQFEESGLAVTVFRPGNFFDNMFAFLETISSGFFTLPLDGSVKIPHIAASDIAEYARLAFKRGPQGFEVYDLAYPDPVSMFDIAMEVSDNLGRMIKYMRISDEQFIEVFTGFGISYQFCEDMLAMFRWFEQDDFRFDPQKTIDKFGHTPRSLQEFIPELTRHIK